MYVATASPRPKRSAFDSSRGGECALCSPPLDPPLQVATLQYSSALSGTVLNNHNYISLGTRTHAR